MTLKLKYINTFTTNPYRNLAFEEYMLNNVYNGECILYLWQNRHTVVIGKNQNAYKECKISELENDGGFLARRPSGGGAVYHDMGNLNFTFITTSAHYNVDKQLSVIVEAVKAFGIHAKKSGRNDICIDGRKFSGNAFLKKGDKMYHHGTILADVDMSQLSKYLNVSAQKLKSKGVDSVKSRVVNLRELCDSISTDNLRHSLVNAFEKVYGGTAYEINENHTDNDDIKLLTTKYESAKWKYGENMKADVELCGKFPWGEIGICFRVNSGIIDDALVYTDSMDTELPDKLRGIFIGKMFSKQLLLKLLSESADNAVNADNAVKDIAKLIAGIDF